MATWADVLTQMAILDRSLRVGSGQADETLALGALVMAQHQFEIRAALIGGCLASQVNIATVTNQEYSLWPTSLLRIDGVQQLDANGFPISDIVPIGRIGGHVPQLPWPTLLSVSPSGTGTPAAYWATWERFYWMPRPNAVTTYRVYGLLEQAEPGARATTFPYPLRVKQALAAYACRVLKLGLQEQSDASALKSIADEMFTAVLKGFERLNRSAPLGRVYTQVHTT